MGRLAEVLSREDRILRKARSLLDAIEPRSGGASLRFHRQLTRAFGYMNVKGVFVHARRAEFAALYARLAVALQAMTRTSEAEDAARRALSFDPENADALEIHGAALLGRGAAEDALRDFDAALKLAQTRASLWRRRGDALVALGKREEAVTSFAQAIHLDPSDVEAYEHVLSLNPDDGEMWFRKAEARRARRDLENAAADYDRATRLAPDRPDIWYGRAVALHGLKLHERALHDLERAAAVGLDPGQYWRLRAAVLRDQGSLVEALEGFDSALRFEEKDADLLAGRASVLHLLGRNEDAIRSCDDALDARPNDLPVLDLKRACLAALQDWPGVEDVCSLIVRLEPHRPDALFGRADALVRLHRPKDALPTLDALLAVEPLNYDGLALKRRVLERLDRWEDVLAVSDAMLRLHPREADALRARGLALLRLGRPGPALRTLDAALAERPGDLEILREKAGAMGLLGMDEEALEVLDGALQVDPSDRNLWIAKGHASIRLERNASALECFEKALSLNPGDRGALAEAGDLLLAAGRADAALRTFEDGLLIDPGNPRFILGKAACLVDSERSPEALLVLTPILESNPNHTGALKLQAKALFKLGRAGDALVAADRALVADSSDADLLSLKAHMLLSLGRVDEAADAFRASADLTPDRPEGWRGLAAAALRAKRTREAVYALERAVSVARNDKSLHSMLGFAREQAGDYAGAVRAYRDAISLDADDKTSWNSQGVALMHLQKYEDAIRCFETALALDPGYEVAADGKRICTRRIEQRGIEAAARSVVSLERSLRRPASRDEMFRRCRVPLDLLDGVAEYVNSPPSLRLDALSPEQIRRYEAGAGVLLIKFGARDDLRLVDAAVALPRWEFGEARNALGYLQGVRALHLEPSAEWHNDELVLRALKLPKAEWNYVDLARHLRLGPYEAKKLEVSLRLFEGGGYRIRTEREDEPETAALRKSRSRSEGADARCEAHGAPGLLRHRCGAVLCTRCLAKADRCPGCGRPVPAAHRLEAGPKARSRARGPPQGPQRTERGPEGEAPQPAERPRKARPPEEPESSRDFSRL